jgi:hypothetical protein
MTDQGEELLQELVKSPVREAVNMAVQGVGKAGDGVGAPAAGKFADQFY